MGLATGWFFSWVSTWPYFISIWAISILLCLYPLYRYVKNDRIDIDSQDTARKYMATVIVGFIAPAVAIAEAFEIGMLLKRKLSK